MKDHLHIIFSVHCVHVIIKASERHWVTTVI